MRHQALDRTALLQALGIIFAFAVVGAGCGLLWQLLWTPPTGVVQAQRWVPDPEGLRADFSGTALYVAIALPAGLAVGTLAAWRCTRSELVTLAAVALGSAVAAWVMLRVGLLGSPPDPQTVARTAADGTRLPGRLHVSQESPYLALPLGAMVSSCLIYLLFPRKVSEP